MSFICFAKKSGNRLFNKKENRVIHFLVKIWDFGWLGKNMNKSLRNKRGKRERGKKKGKKGERYLSKNLIRERGGSRQKLIYIPERKEIYLFSRSLQKYDISLLPIKDSIVRFGSPVTDIENQGV